MTIQRFSTTHRICTGIETYILYKDNQTDIDADLNVLTPHPDFDEEEEIRGDHVSFTMNKNVEGDYSFFVRIQNIDGGIKIVGPKTFQVKCGNSSAQITD